MKKILVTGGAGFIGSHVVKALLSEGYQVTVFDNLCTGSKEAIDKTANFIKGDIANSTEVERALAGQDAVIHMAGLIIVPESVAFPEKYFHTNIFGGFVLLNAMKKTKVNKIIFSSSAAVYGNPLVIPISEDDPKHPSSPYGASKLAFEALLSAFYQSYNLSVVSLRYFNAYGPFENHNPETHAIPLFIKAVLQNQPIPITGSIEQVRDYVYVEDIACAHVKALKLNGLYELNLGSGNGVSLKELVKALQEISGKKIEIVQTTPRPGDPFKLIAKTANIKTLLNWQPKVSLKKGLNRTFAYFKNLS